MDIIADKLREWHRVDPFNQGEGFLLGSQAPNQLLRSIQIICLERDGDTKKKLTIERYHSRCQDSLDETRISILILSAIVSLLKMLILAGKRISWSLGRISLMVAFLHFLGDSSVVDLEKWSRHRELRRVILSMR